MQRLGDDAAPRGARPADPCPPAHFRPSNAPNDGSRRTAAAGVGAGRELSLHPGPARVWQDLHRGAADCVAGGAGPAGGGDGHQPQGHSQHAGRGDCRRPRDGRGHHRTQEKLRDLRVRLRGRGVREHRQQRRVRHEHRADRGRDVVALRARRDGGTVRLRESAANAGDHKFTATHGSSVPGRPIAMCSGWAAERACRKRVAWRCGPSSNGCELD